MLRRIYISVAYIISRPSDTVHRKMDYLKMEYLILVLAMNVMKSDAGFDLRNPGQRLETSHFGVKPADKKCHDFCALMADLCRNGGSCILDDDTCIASCVCAPGWSGRWCRDDVPIDGVSPGSELQALEDVKHTANVEIKTSFDGLEQNNISSVVKDSEPSTETNETKVFRIHAKEVIKPEEVINVLNKSMDDTIFNVSNGLDGGNVDSASRDVTECLKTCIDGDCIDKDGQYICTRRIELSQLKGPKECQPGFVCQHGVCDVESLEKGLKCICEPNFIGTFCDMECPFDCGDYGVCDYHVDDHQLKCFCQWNYTGLNCTELIPLPPEEAPVVFHWYVVGISISIVVTVLAVLAFIPYWMWRKRLVFILKIVHYFQQYEEDDGREYDAFISYKSTPADEKFVLQYLFPKLEAEMRFKLCLHFRDFLPGEAIANNIVKAIENSRRTIMVLSPAYVNSEWCRMEYQKAQHEMLKLKHRIIPIVLEDISKCSNMDRNLRGILNSVTYIEWPGEENSKRLERFWKKIELSLPKKSSSSKHLCSNMHPSSSAPASLTTSMENQTDSEIQNITDDTEKNGANCSSESSSDAASLDSGRRSPRFRKNKTKDLKHFMGKLVRGKIFVRQDSTSSRAALVDEETGYSKGSYDSVSESMFTESTDSACSTPATAHSYLNESEDENLFFSGKTYDLDSPCETKKEIQNDTCEKDHCDYSACTSCSKRSDTERKRRTSYRREHLNEGFSDSIGVGKVACRRCKEIKEGADNNIVKVSPIEGSDMLKIQRVSGERYWCDKCSEKIELTHTESEKRRKDEENMKLLRQTRMTRSLSHRRTASLKGITLNVRDLPGHVRSENQEEMFIDICENV